MARDFSKNLSNYASLGTGFSAPLNGVAAFSFACWLNLDSVAAVQNDNDLITLIPHTTAGGFVVNIDGSVDRRVRVSGRSTSSDSRLGRSGTTTVPLTTWVHVGGVIDYANKIITPYYNGAAENGGAAGAGWANLSYTYGTPTIPDGIGSYAPGTGSATTAAQIDGRMAEVALWTTDIGARNFASLATGAPPSRIAPGFLYEYWPLLGNANPEPGIRRRINLAITGSVPAARHPKVAR